MLASGRNHEGNDVRHILLAAPGFLVGSGPAPDWRGASWGLCSGPNDPDQ